MKHLQELREASGLERFEARTEKPMIVLTLVFLGILIAPEVMPHMDIGMRHDLLVLDWMIWGVFVMEYCTRLTLALDRSYFVGHNVLDLQSAVRPRCPFRSPRVSCERSLTPILASWRMLSSA